MYTEQELIEYGHKFFSEKGEVPRARDFCKKNGYVNKDWVYNKFGSWNTYLLACGFPLNNKYTKIPAKDEIISVILNFYNTTGLVPTQDELLLNNYVTARHGGFNFLLKEAGLTPVHIKKYPKDYLLKNIVDFVINNNRIPQAREFIGKNGVPSYTTYINTFGSWNTAILEAGFIPDYNDGYGTRTIGLDGNLYRSKAEAYFCDTFLYNKYEYIVEPKYPEPYNKFYDWYIPELDLYIELTGGLRPDNLKDKRDINIKLNRNLSIIILKDIYKYQNLLSLINHKVE